VRYRLLAAGAQNGVGLHAAAALVPEHGFESRGLLQEICKVPGLLRTRPFRAVHIARKTEYEHPDVPPLRLLRDANGRALHVPFLHREALPGQQTGRIGYGDADAGVAEIDGHHAQRITSFRF
jgi:hypothetical protein